ncbi:MAG: alanine and proline-rich secreted protein Apa [Proteobacteria bacterium]|nr:alanine and proline-rich secreted protein Apa [Pseudomonadota bacterium]MBU4448347.1 alanine and proline-rich secreted protein Apa [Pseudomonadota bacterium]
MRKTFWLLAVAALCGLSFLALAPPDLMAQWGVIKRGIEATQPGQPATSPAPAPEDPNAPFNRAQTGATFQSPTTFKNRVRPFSYTIPAGWQKEGGDPTGERADLGRPGSTASFNFHFTQMVPSFPRKAAVDASYKQAKEEMSIGKYMSVKRRDQRGKNGVIGWETIETAAKGSGGFQRIQWQCYDKNNYYYTFMTAVNPQQFNQYRAEMQRIIDSIQFEP